MAREANPSGNGCRVPEVPGRKVNPGAQKSGCKGIVRGLALSTSSK